MPSSEKAANVQRQRSDEGLYYGGRKSDKFVRCYEKDELAVFRVELELHSGLLRQHSVSTLADFRFLPGLIYPKHLLFVEVDWKRLEQYLAKRFGTHGSHILAGAREREVSLQRVRKYLTSRGVVNVHRFLMPLAMNEKVVAALNKFARTFGKQSNG